MKTLTFFLATGTALANVQFAQQLLAVDEPSFLSTSIFKQSLDVNNHVLSPLIPLPPSYRPRDYDATEDWEYAGPQTFAHLPFVNCFAPDANSTFDIAIVGAPFDLGVSYRPGARFGPTGARLGMRRISPQAGWDLDHGGVNPFRSWATVVDCGDIANTPFDKLIALQELERGWRGINAQTAKNTSASSAVRVISVGGDHTITLPILRALHKTWGKVSVIHFDSHLDTWDPAQLGGGISRYADVNHGTMLHIAHEEHLLTERNIHVGSRCALFDEHFDLGNDLRCGFGMVRAREFYGLGVEGVVERIVRQVHGEHVYLSVDIDVLDPAFAPATGTIEPGGLSTRELLAVIDGLAKAGLKIVGADVVEFSPIYDNAAETTALAVGQIVYEILHWMVRVPVRPGKK